MSGGVVWVEDPNENSLLGKKNKRKVGKRKIEFVGWGSKPLIEFLVAIGKDSTSKLTQHEVAALIIKYINENNLFAPEKKKKVLCDERLYAIFAKKSMLRAKVYEMLEEHLAENHDESEDEFTDSSDEESCRGRKRIVKLKTIPLKPKSCFAAVVPDNIKLVYLARSLVQDFLKFPESFDSKIVGSFVRMRSDPFDIYQKNPFQLQLVTGVEKVSEASRACTEVRLQVANYLKDIPISKLSDEMFTDEEIEDMRDRIKAGALQRLTVVELGAKAQTLHSDITKHGIARELILLKRRIDRANEKGWRKELLEYLDRRKLLQTPSEVEKLLHKIPEVIAEEVEPDISAMTPMPSENVEGNGCSPTSILRGTSDVSSTDASGFGDLAIPLQAVADDLPTPRRGNVEMDSGVILAANPFGSGDLATPSKVVIDFSIGTPTGQTGDAGLTRNSRGQDEISIADWLKRPTHTSEQVQEIGQDEISIGDWLKRPTHTSEQVQEIDDQPADRIHEVTSVVDSVRNLSRKEIQMPSTVGKSFQQLQVTSSRENTPKEKPQQSTTAPLVIALSDDESDSDEPNSSLRNNLQISSECPDSNIWCYLDPQGIAQGPFSLSALKRWHDASYFNPGFTVWKKFQSRKEAVLLSDVLGRNFQF